MHYNFEWDLAKATLNFKKHSITFNEATSVFRDPLALSIYDNFHSHSEERWLTLGISNRGRILVVCHTYMRKNGKRVSIRIFSSRKANQREQGHYKG